MPGHFLGKFIAGLCFITPSEAAQRLLFGERAIFSQAQSQASDEFVALQLRQRQDRHEGAQCNDAPVKSLIVGDFGLPGQLQTEIAAGMNAVASSFSPQFVVGLGDNVYEDGATDFDHIDRYWQQTFLKDHNAVKVPWHIIAGNHDWRSDPRIQINFTNSQATMGSWEFPHLWFKKSSKSCRGNVDFFYVDTMVFLKLANTERYFGRGYEDMYEEQLEWLRKELSASTADWKVVFGHHCLYTTGLHRSKAVEGGPLRVLDDLMREFGVTLYFNGHNHNTEVIQYKGVTYVTSGNGAKSYAYPGGICFKGCGDHFVPPDAPKDWSKFYDCAGGFVGLTLTNTHDATLVVFDRFGKPFQNGSFVVQNTPPQQNPPSLLQLPAGETCQGVSLARVELACDACEVLPAPTADMTCDAYCAEHGLSCHSARRSVHRQGNAECALIGPQATCKDLAREGAEDQELICRCS